MPTQIEMTTAEGHALVPRAPESIALPTNPTPMQILQLAVAQGANIDTIERLAALQDKMLARESEIAFNDALSSAQEECKPVSADLENPQTRSKYASYNALDNRIRPIYVKHRFSLSYNTGDSPKPEHVRVFAYLARGGHMRTYQLDMPADGKGAKGGDVMTKTHATAAATSYGKRYLLKMIFNIAEGEADTDGNSVTMDDVLDHIEYIQNAKDMQELQRLFIAAKDKAKAAGDLDALRRIIAAKDTKKRELQ